MSLHCKIKATRAEITQLIEFYQLEIGDRRDTIKELRHCTKIYRQLIKQYNADLTLEFVA